MSKKLKTYVLRVSEVFPTTHPRAGEETYFRPAIEAALNCPRGCTESCILCGNRDYKEGILRLKLHTLRTNYDYWKRIIDEVNAGNAVLSVRYWQGKPFAKGSKQIECLSLGKGEVGIQKLQFMKFDKPFYIIDKDIKRYLTTEDLANNDGLTLEDFENWFGDSFYDNLPKAIIHFTNFRY